MVKILGELKLTLFNRIIENWQKLIIKEVNAVPNPGKLQGACLHVILTIITSLALQSSVIRGKHISLSVNAVAKENIDVN